MRYINEAGLEIIKEFEGLRLTAYADPLGIATIGYGNTNSVTKEDIGVKTITKEEAEKLLNKDVKWAEISVFKSVKVPITDNQFSALVSWTFNLGSGNLNKSTMLKKINENHLKVVPTEMRKWNRAGGIILEGLKRRRSAEAELFLKVLIKNDISLKDLKNYCCNGF